MYLFEEIRSDRGVGGQTKIPKFTITPVLLGSHADDTIYKPTGRVHAPFIVPSSCVPLG